MMKKIVVVDGHSTTRRIFEAIKDEEEHLRPASMISSAMGTFRRILREHEPTHMLCVFDHPEAKHHWRHQIFPEYKANRSPSPPGFTDALPVLADSLAEDLGVCSLSIPELEADDVVATIAKRWVDNDMGEAVIVSTDKDLATLVQYGVQVWNAFANEYRDEAWIQKKFQCKPEQLLDTMAFIGDAVDNVPGCPGIGPATAAKLIARFGSLDEVIAKADYIKGAQGAKVRSNVDALKLSRELIRLKTDLTFGFSAKELRVSADSAWVKFHGWSQAPALQNVPEFS